MKGETVRGIWARRGWDSGIVREEIGVVRRGWMGAYCCCCTCWFFVETQDVTMLGDSRASGLLFKQGREKRLADRSDDSTGYL